MSYFVIIRGPLGSGKSTIAQELAKKIKAEYFAVDRVLDEYHLTSDREEGYISQKSFLHVNEIIAPKAISFLKKGKPVIFDGNFYWKSQIEDLIKRINYPHFIFTLRAPLKVCLERDAHREKSHGKDATEAVYEKSTSFTYGTEIDATQPKEKIIKKIISLLPYD
ncbi:MAG: AAA family ATPase [Candidatus Woesearchaeota archaeon]